MLTDDPLWYKDAILYELHVRSFHDAVGDGVGDFRGLAQKLDYLEDLGVTAIWLLPFYPSPLKDDGYDIADYTEVNPRYGNLNDFRHFLDEAHRRGLRVITELVINHTSDQHPWFQRARRAPKGSVERDFYVWNDTPDKYPNVPLMFPDFETSNWTWDPIAQQYFWHRFYAHQPDLNYDNPAVWEAIFPVVDFWMRMGVDAMRLDAVPYLFEREGTPCEHLPETHGFLKALRKHTEERFPNRMFLAEANAWPEDAVAYFGSGDECHMAFHFPLMPRLFMALHQEDRFPLHDILAQTPTIPDNCQWCLFLRNHDELTLAMVTDEERDYMFRAYARDRESRIFLGIRHRLAPLLKNDRRQIELMNGLLFSFPGSPVIYYGDEIGMGDNIYLGDRNGVRTPMQWSADRNAGFSRANPQKLFLPIIIDPEFHYEAINVEAQQNNPSSLLWWMKRLIALRKRHRAFSRGSMQVLRTNNPKTLAFLRRHEDDVVVVVANLSRFVQPVEIDLREFQGLKIIELFGRSRFPSIGESPYPLTLGPHSFYWLSLVQDARPASLRDGDPALIPLPAIQIAEKWTEVVTGVGQGDLETALAEFFQKRQPVRRESPIVGCRILDSFPLTRNHVEVKLVTVRVEFRANVVETVLLPISFAAEEQVAKLLAPLTVVGIARVLGPHPGFLVDALGLPEYSAAVVQAMVESRSYPIPGGVFLGVPLPGLETLLQPHPNEPPTHLRHIDQNHLTVVFGERMVLKTFRRLEEGRNPDLEVGQYLSERLKVTGIAPLVGYLEARMRSGESITLAALHCYTENQGDAWQLLLNQLSPFFERVATLSKEAPPPPPLVGPYEVSEEWIELAGPSAATARALGQRIADIHLALAADRTAPAFAPEQATKTYQRSLYQSLRNLAEHTQRRLAQPAPEWPEAMAPLARRVLDLQEAILFRFQDVLDAAVFGSRIRVHGNLHLGKFLFTGNDFVIADFEGDATKTIGERRIKRSPLRDVASMIRSFDYLVGAPLLGWAGGKRQLPGWIRPEDLGRLKPWAEAWAGWMARSLLESYLSSILPANLLPPTEPGRVRLLEVFLLERSLQEVDYDLTYRPEWAQISLTSVLRLVRPAAG